RVARCVGMERFRGGGGHDGRRVQVVDGSWVWGMGQLLVALALQGLAGGTVILDLHPALSDLIDVATKRGWLSYEELNNTLPDEWVDPDRLHELLVYIDQLGVELIDEMEYKARKWRASTRAGANGTELSVNGVAKPLRAMSVAGGDRPTASSN